VPDMVAMAAGLSRSLWPGRPAPGRGGRHKGTVISLRPR
jgi:hypothetical protein